MVNRIAYGFGTNGSGGGGSTAWGLNGNLNGSLKYIGTNDDFDFPIYSNGVEIGRFVAGSYATFTYSLTAGAFIVGETVTNGLGGIGTVIVVISPTSAIINKTAGTFSPTNTITGATSLKSAVVSTIVPYSADGRLFINQTTTDNGSNAGGQLSALRPNRAQWRFNQYGENNAGGGVTTFKSRSVIIGAPLSAGAGVLVGDIIQGFTAIAVTGSGLLIPIAYTQRVTAVDVTSGNVACDWEISLAPIGGATNSIRKAFAVTSEGIQKVRETVNCMAGVAVLDATGTIVIANTNVKANTRFLLTVQDGGVAPTGMVYQSARTINTDFTIKSNAGVADAGVQVYYQLYEPLT